MSSLFRFILVFFSLIFFVLQIGAAQEANKEETKAVEVKPPASKEILVKSSKPRSAASSRSVRKADLEVRPIVEPADMLEVAPGLFAVQHSGGGKAPQYFIRGFDIDHGTDLAILVDEVPVNMVSHGHGQGYADIHFIIPAMYDEVLVKKGPYFSDVGDFATAGSIEFKSIEKLKESFVSYTGGMFHTHNISFASQVDGDKFSPIIAADAFASDGPFENPERLRRLNLFFKNTAQLSNQSKFNVTALGYSNSWNASGQLPERAVANGLVSRFGTLDASEGGETQRYSFQVGYESASDKSIFESTLYLVKYNFGLYSNFTFFKDDSVNGDQIAQFDDRVLAGGKVTQRYYYEVLTMPMSSMFGIALRSDSIENTLWRSKSRKLIQPKVDAEIQQTNTSIFFEQEIEPLRWLHLIAGVRAESYVAQVNDRLEDRGTTAAVSSSPDGPASSGQSHDEVVLPKASLIITPLKNWQLFLNYGIGFHSNDARGTVIRNDPAKQPVSPMTRAFGYEAGSRLGLFKRIELAASAWLLDLESEIVWIGDEGGTEASGRTRRMGIDAEIRFRVFDWLYLDSDLTFNTAKFRDNPGNSNAVALAPSQTITAGITLEKLKGFSGSVRMRHIAARPANEDKTLTAEGFTIFDLFLSYRWRNLEVFSIVKNLTNSEWKEVQFATESQLQGEVSPVEEIHFVPGSSFQATGGLKVYF